MTSRGVRSASWVRPSLVEVCRRIRRWVGEVGAAPAGISVRTYLLGSGTLLEVALVAEELWEASVALKADLHVDRGSRDVR